MNQPETTVVQTRARKIPADAAMIILIIVFPHLGLLPMYVFPFLILTIMFFYLKRTGENFRSIGLNRQNRSWFPLAIAALSGIAYALVAKYGIAPLVARMGLPEADVSDFYSIRGNFPNFIFLLIIAWLIVIPFEEISFRGFIFSRIQYWLISERQPVQGGQRSDSPVLPTSPRKLPGTSKSFWISAAVTSVLFSVYHYQEGAGAVVQILIFGMFQMYLFKKVDGNLWPLILFHGFYDTVILGCIYLGIG